MNPTTMSIGLRIAGVIALLSSAVSPRNADAGLFDQHQGKATFYGYGGGGNCSLPVPDMLTAAMNQSDYAGSQACGACAEVTNANTGQSVVVRIDDQCPECAPGDIDLSEPAFAQIGPREAGILPITWRYVACSYPSMKLYFKEGSSQWWTAVQVREHRYPIKSLAWRASGSGAAYVTLPREPYNYFLAASGMGPGPYDIRITDANDQVIVATSVPLAVTTPLDIGQQFPAVGTPPPPPKACADGADNDGDGRVDYPADPGCSALDDNDETDTAPPPATQPQVAQTISNDWGSGYCANVRVTNPGTQPLTWRINFSIQGSVYTSWNVVLSQSGAIVTASGVGWNATVQGGQYAEFGYCANR
jgi:expansin